MDLLGPLNKTGSGNVYILVITDYLTKWPEAVPLKDKSAATVCHALTEVICRYGIPRTIISDQGREFCNALNKSLCERLLIKHNVTSPYHPQANGLTERFNRSLADGLIKYVNKNQDNWDEVLPTILFAHRTSIQRSTKKSPFYLTYGREARLPGDTEEFESAANAFPHDENIKLEVRLERIETLLQEQGDAKLSINNEQQKQKRYLMVDINLRAML